MVRVAIVLLHLDVSSSPRYGIACYSMLQLITMCYIVAMVENILVWQIYHESYNKISLTADRVVGVIDVILSLLLMGLPLPVVRNLKVAIGALFGLGIR